MSIKKNYAYNTLNQILRIFISIVSIPYISRVLGATNIGIYSYTNTIASYFILFIILGLDNYGNREIAKIKKNKILLNHVFTEIYFMQLIIGLIVIFVYYIYLIYITDKYKIIFIVQSVYVISAIIDINWAMCGLEAFKFTSLRNCIVNIINLILILIFVKSPNSLLLYTIIMSVGSIVNNITAWLYIRKYINFVKVEVNDIVKHIKPNLILFIPIVAVSLYKMMDKVMLGLMASIEQVGFYENSEKIIKIPTVLISSLGTVMLPHMTSIYSDGKNTKASEYLERSLYIAMIISTSLCFGIMSISREFVPVFYGKGYEVCILIYLILLPCCVFLAFSNVIRTQYLIPRGKDKQYIKAVIMGAVVNLMINFVGIPRFGAVGAAIGTLIAEITVCSCQAIEVRTEIPIKKYIHRCLPFISLGCIMFAILYMVDFGVSNIVQIFIKVILGILIYIVGLLCILSFREIYGVDIKSLKRM